MDEGGDAHRRVTFTLKKYKALERRYKKAVKNSEEVFIFEGREYVTLYAYYVLQVLKFSFGDTSERR